jgi:hypothetical protein
LLQIPLQKQQNGNGRTVRVARGCPGAGKVWFARLTAGFADPADEAERRIHLNPA